MLVVIEFSTDSGEAKFVAQFDGWLPEYDKLFLDAIQSGPGTVQGLRDVLSIVQTYARDFRRRGLCPGCEESQPRLLTAEYCAGCCLEAAVCGRLPA